MIEFTQNEIEFLENNEACRIATSFNDIPHVTPVTYYFENGLFYIATDYNTKKYSNLIKNKNVAVTIDIYLEGKHKAVIVQGTAEFIERGKEYMLLYEIFFKKFYWVKETPWEEGEAPFIKITPQKRTSWGLN
ncbi:MAG: pyridoxamine 5'-phosphate oxidase family protein [Nitrosopumilaceae archaeon]